MPPTSGLTYLLSNEVSSPSFPSRGQFSEGPQCFPEEEIHPSGSDYLLCKYGLPIIEEFIEIDPDRTSRIKPESTLRYEVACWETGAELSSGIFTSSGELRNFLNIHKYLGNHLQFMCSKCTVWIGDIHDDGFVDFARHIFHQYFSELRTCLYIILGACCFWLIFNLICLLRFYLAHRYFYPSDFVFFQSLFSERIVAVFDQTLKAHPDAACKLPSYLFVLQKLGCSQIEIKQILGFVFSTFAFLPKDRFDVKTKIDVAFVPWDTETNFMTSALSSQMRLISGTSFCSWKDIYSNFFLFRDTNGAISLRVMFFIREIISLMEKHRPLLSTVTPEVQPRGTRKGKRNFRSVTNRMKAISWDDYILDLVISMDLDYEGYRDLAAKHGHPPDWNHYNYATIIADSYYNDIHQDDDEFTQFAEDPRYKKSVDRLYYDGMPDEERRVANRKAIKMWHSTLDKEVEYDYHGNRVDDVYSHECRFVDLPEQEVLQLDESENEELPSLNGSPSPDPSVFYESGALNVIFFPQSVDKITTFVRIPCEKKQEISTSESALDLTDFFEVDQTSPECIVSLIRKLTQRKPDSIPSIVDSQPLDKISFYKSLFPLVSTPKVDDPTLVELITIDSVDSITPECAPISNDWVDSLIDTQPEKAVEAFSKVEQVRLNPPDLNVHPSKAVVPPMDLTWDNVSELEDALSDYFHKLYNEGKITKGQLDLTSRTELYVAQPALRTIRSPDVVPEAVKSSKLISVNRVDLIFKENFSKILDWLAVVSGRQDTLEELFASSALFNCQLEGLKTVITDKANKLALRNHLNKLTGEVEVETPILPEGLAKEVQTFNYVATRRCVSCGNSMSKDNFSKKGWIRNPPQCKFCQEIEQNLKKVPVKVEPELNEPEGTIIPESYVANGQIFPSKTPDSSSGVEFLHSDNEHIAYGEFVTIHSDGLKLHYLVTNKHVVEERPYKIISNVFTCKAEAFCEPMTHMWLKLDPHLDVAFLKVTEDMSQAFNSCSYDITSLIYSSPIPRDWPLMLEVFRQGKWWSSPAQHNGEYNRSFSRCEYNAQTLSGDCGKAVLHNGSLIGIHAGGKNNKKSNVFIYFGADFGLHLHFI